MERGKKKLRRGVGILLAFLMVCGTLHGGRALSGVVAAQGEDGAPGNGESAGGMSDVPAAQGKQDVQKDGGLPGNLSVEGGAAGDVPSDGNSGTGGASTSCGGAHTFSEIWDENGKRQCTVCGEEQQAVAKVSYNANYSDPAYAESLEKAFTLTKNLAGAGDIMRIILLDDVVLEKGISVDCAGTTYLKPNGHTIYCNDVHNPAFNMENNVNFSFYGDGAIYAAGTAFKVSAGELTIGGKEGMDDPGSGDVYIYAQGDKGIEAAKGNIRLMNVSVSAQTTALYLEDNHVELISGVLQAVSGSAIAVNADREVSSGASTILESLLWDKESHYKDKTGQKIEVSVDQKTIPEYCSMGDFSFAPTVSVKFAEDVLTYNGQAQEPPFTVSIQGIPMRKADYDVRYEDNVNAGQGRVVATIMNPLYGVKEASGTFPILPAIPQLSWQQEGIVVHYTGQPVELPEGCLVITLQNGENFADISQKPVQYSYRPEGETAYTLGLPTALGSYRIKAAVLEEENYTTAETETDLDLRIEKALRPVPEPKDEMHVPYSDKTLADVELLEGWEWQDTGILLEVGISVQGVAVYVKEDSGNYLETEVTVSVIRDECLHRQTEKSGTRDADCENAGYTGDLVCVECKTVREAGEEIPALGHDYGSEVTKQPTTSEVGIRTYTCGRCKHSYQEEIDKLPQTPGGGPGVDPAPDTTPAPVPTVEPITPTPEPKPTTTPVQPTVEPTTPTPEPTTAPAEPTGEPTTPTPEPTTAPAEPTGEPTSPTPEPTTTPAEPTSEPTAPNPTTTPTQPTTIPADEPKPGEPFIRTDGDGTAKKGWDAILEEAGRAGDGDNIVVDMNGAAVVPKEVLESIRDRDVTIVLDLGNGIKWSISGEDITAEELGDINFSVQTGTNTIPVDVINMITGERYTIQVSLAYDGEFGLTATLTVELGSENAGYNASLYYYNPETNSLEYIAVVEILEDGTASWKFTHASDYVIVVWEEEEGDPAVLPEEPSGGQDDPAAELPDTGMAWKSPQFFLIGMILVFVGFGTMFFWRGREEAYLQKCKKWLRNCKKEKK